MKAIRIALYAGSALLFAACSETYSTAPSDDLSPALTKASVSGNKLQCFSDFGASCTLIGNGANLVVPVGGYAGAYVENSNLNGKKLETINKFSFVFSGGPLSGGSPRITFPIDIDGDGVTVNNGYDDYVSIDALGCGISPLATSGTVDPLNNSACIVSLNGGGTYSNWAAFLAAFPNARVASNLPFIIVDQPGTFTITEVQLGRADAKSKS